MTSGGLLVRILACFFLVFATWNPTGYSWLHWIDGPAPLAAKAAATAALLLLHILFIRITALSLGLAGFLLTFAGLVLGVFTLRELGVIDLSQPRTRAYLSLTVVALVMTTGVAWSLAKRRLTGQSNYLNPPP
ncbi:MAG: DUF6524 family protein [Acetobacteraceae bacterium]